jgi:ketosteroid isomerase-like protein
MSQENVEVIRAIYAAWDARDLDALLEVTDPEIEFWTSGYFPDFEPIYRGHQGLRSFWEAMLVPWDESFRIDVEHIVRGTTARPSPSASAREGRAAASSPISGRVMPCTLRMVGR